MSSTRYACKRTATYICTLKLAGKVNCESNFFKIRCYAPFQYFSLLQQKRISHSHVILISLCDIFMTNIRACLFDRNNVCDCILAFSSLNRWRTKTERTCILCSSTLVWCGLQVTGSHHKDNMCVLNAKFSCNFVQ